MQIPVQITFQGLDESDALQDAVRAHVEELERYHDHITSCRVVLTAPHRRGQQGRRYAVRVDLTVPGSELVVNRARRSPAHEDVHVALRDAFRAARRRLEDQLRRERRQVKRRAAQSYARVARLVPAEGYGFLVTEDGREVYFHRNSLVDAEFDALEVGAPVRFHEARGRDGPRASTVRLAGRHNQLA